VAKGWLISGQALTENINVHVLSNGYATQREKAEENEVILALNFSVLRIRFLRFEGVRSCKGM
jgi:hypothetical protein